ncbi:MAG TPA: PAS domain S-box protein [Methanospirillum sp.]|nr:PAS domain S-box protein [Methanospirillum sp.]
MTPEIKEKIRILSIDDDPVLLDVAKQFLDRVEGFEVTTAENAINALQLLSHQEFDVIISDYEMDQMNGIELLKHLRATGETIPFIIFTGKGQEEVVIEALNNGADFYLQKGDQPGALFAELSNKIQQVVSHRWADSDLLKKNKELLTAYEELSAAQVIIHSHLEKMTTQETLIRINEERLRMAQEIGQIGCWEYDGESDTIWGSAEGLRIFGFPPVARDLPINEIEACIPENERVHQALVDLVTNGSPYDLEYIIHPADGSLPRVVHSVARLDTDLSGNLVRVMGIVQDITRRKEVETDLLSKNEELYSAYEEISASEQEIRSHLEELTRQEILVRESAQRFQSLYTHMIEGAVLHKIIYNDQGVPEDYRIIETNPAFEVQLGINRDAVIGKTSREAYGVTDPPYLDLYVQVALTGEPQVFETYFPPLDKYFSISVYSPSRGSFATIFEDITARKLAEVEREQLIVQLGKNNEELSAAYEELLGTEEELKLQYSTLFSTEENLRQTKDFLENLISIANVPIIVWDPSFQIIRLNRAFEQLIGRPAQSVIGNSLKFLFPPDQADRSMRLFQTTLEGVRWETTEIDIMHRDGSLRTLLWNSATLYTLDGLTPVATIAQGHDITEERRLEQDKDAALVQIQQNLAYLAILNDEIRNPLTIIVTYADMLDDPQIVDQITIQAGRIDELVNQLDRRWVQSEKVLNAIRKHYQIHAGRLSPSESLKEDDIALSGSLPRQEEPLEKTDGILIEEVQAQLYTILNSIDSLVYVADMQTDQILFMNGQGRAVFGDIVGQNCHACMHGYPDGPCPVCTNSILLDPSRASQVFQWEWQNSKNARWYDCRSRVIRWSDGRLVRIEIATDITEQKITGDALRTSEEKYRLTLEATNDGLWDWDIPSGTTNFSSRFYTMLGYEPGEFPATYAAWKGLIHPDEQDLVVSDLIRQIQEKCEFPHIEYRIRAKNGEWRWIYGRGKPVAYDEKGDVLRLIGTNTDITQRKETEVALRESEERYRQLVHNVPDYILVHRKGKILYVNPTAAISMGYTPDEVIGTDLMQYLVPESQSLVASMIQSRITGKEIPSYEITLLTRDGRHKRTEVRGVLVQYDGEPASLNVLTDITEQKKTLESLRESEEKYRQLVEHANDAIVVAQKGMMQLVNPQMAELTGYQTEELLSLPFPHFIHPDDRAMVVAMHQKRLNGEHIPSRYTFRLTKKDGSITWVEISAVAIEWEGNPATLNFLVDITDRRLAEETLRKGAERLAIATHAGGIGIWELDLINDNLIWDDQMYQLFGIRPDTYVGPYEAWHAGVSVDDLAMNDAELRKAIIGDKEFDAEFRVLWPDGTVHYLHAHARVHHDTDGRPISLIGTNYDITERRRTEESLHEAIAKLRLLTSLTRHDIFNQLTAVHLLQDMAIESSDLEQIRDYLTRSQRLNAHIGEIIGFTREYENFGIVSSSWQRIYSFIDAAKGEVSLEEVHVEAGIPEDLEVYADPIIRKVFTTLMENAIRHGQGVRTIRFTSYRHNNSLILTCEDDGIGVAIDEKDLIFNHGYGKNTGIGLFLCREILSITGMSICECGEPGKGARFEILVPAGKFRRVSEYGQ